MSFPKQSGSLKFGMYSNPLKRSAETAAELHTAERIALIR
jgi:hypothetical protein